MRRFTLLLATLTLVGCGPNLGLEGNIPLEEAESMTPSDLVAAVHEDVRVEPAEVIMDGRLWVPWGAPTGEDQGLRSVGSNQGRTVYAFSWDRAPLDALFVPTAYGWQEYAPVIGRAGSVEAASH